MSLLEAMLARRSRRFAPGMSLPTGPLAYRSQREPDPLREEEEAALAFAARGVTGYALAELPYGPSTSPESSGGNIMTHFVAPRDRQRRRDARLHRLRDQRLGNVDAQATTGLPAR